MEDARRNMLRAGVYLGDINLALASVNKEMPSYARGIDAKALIADVQESSEIEAEIDRWISSGKMETLDSGIVRLILDRAIMNGRFLSAIRCLEILGERDSYIEKLVREGLREVSKGNFADAAHLFVVASNLSLTEGLPLFQYSGFDLHARCTLSPENCVTARPLDNALGVGLDYLLGSRRVFEQVNQIENIEAKSKLLVSVAFERDAGALRFLEAYRRSNQMIEEQNRSLGVITEKLLQISSLVNKLVRSLDSKGYQDDIAFAKLRRTVIGLARDFEQISDLVRNWQFLRIKDRLLRLLESRDEVEKISKEGKLWDIAEEILKAADLVTREDMIGEIERIENALENAQNSMLGRKVHTDEHWQFLREISFKHPIAPLMCCLARFNRRWLVVPKWESPIAKLLREGLEDFSRSGS